MSGVADGAALLQRQALSDDLNRVDMVIESVVRKIERQFHDLNKGDQELTVDGGALPSARCGYR